MFNRLFRPNIEALAAKRDVRGLIKALVHKDEDVRVAAFEALVKIGAPAVEPLLAAFKDEGMPYATAAVLGEIGDRRAVEPLIAALKDSDWDVRQGAARALGEIGDPRAVEPLIAALNDEDMRRRAAEALGEIGDPRAVEPLIAALKDSSQYVRDSAAEALGRIGAPAVEPLIAALKGEWLVREAAAGVLVKIGAPAVELLIAALKDRDEYVRRRAAEALGKIGDPRAVDPLIAALDDSDSDVRQGAARALGKIGDPRAVDPLIAALEDGDEYVRRRAAEALGEIGDPRAVEPLIAALKGNPGGVHDEATVALVNIGAPAVEPLLALLKDSHEYVRCAAAWALGDIGDPRATEPLRSALEDGDEYVRRRAAEALGKIGADAEVSGIADRFSGAHEAKPEGAPAAKITPERSSIRLVESSQLGNPGPGGSTFQEAIQSENARDSRAAQRAYTEALQRGLDPLRQGYAHAQLGVILLNDGDLAGAVEQFTKVLAYNEALYESVHSAAQYLAVIYEETGRPDEARVLRGLVSRTQAKLGYSLSPAAAERIRTLARQARTG